MAILPNSRPYIGWRRGYLTNNCIKEIFDVGKTKLRYSTTAMIKLWRQHLGAQLPGTLPQTLNDRRHQEQCSRHKTIGTIPRYPRDPKKILVQFKKRRVKTLRQDTSPEGRRDWGVKRIPNSPIYIILNDSKHFSRHNSAAKNDQAMGLLSSGKALIPTCNTLDATIAPTCRGTT